MMRRDATLTFFVANARIDAFDHALNQLIAGEAGLWIDGAAQFPIDNVSDAFEDTANQTLRQNRVAFRFGGISLVSHESKYEAHRSPVHSITAITPILA